MSIEALWIAEYSYAGNDGHGVVVIDNGRIYGGDNGHYFVGTIRTDNGNVFADVIIENYWRRDVLPLLPGPGPWPLALTGHFNDTGMHLVAEYAGLPLRVTLVKTRALP